LISKAEMDRSTKPTNSEKKAQTKNGRRKGKKGGRKNGGKD